ncbi:MAG: cation-efflux pump [Bacteroidetes bacterium]|nr:cation-efflux pump [Bacteroidota bacterium]
MESREKIGAAATSVVAAILLTAFKIVVGVTTGSLGILSEAAHSGLDLMAAVMTLFAVRAADRPADSEHHYGHGKFENISALFETLLLLITCYIIGKESITRLFYRHVEIEVTVWSFVVMATSIIIDYTRSRILMRAAKKYHSQALEADALHFSTDILSSSVVIVGLIGARAGFEFADPIAALGVSLIVVVISVRLGKRAIDVLVDRSPDSALVDRIHKAALETGGVEDVKSLRVRVSGGKVFVDMVVRLPRLLLFEQAHSLVDEIENRVRSVRDGVDVVVHAEPVETEKETVADKIRFAAEKSESRIHEVQVFSTHAGLVIDLHLEVSDTDTIEAAHTKADALENSIRAQIGGIDQIFVHIDRSSERTIRAKSTRIFNGNLAADIVKFVTATDGVARCGNLSFAESDLGVRVAMTCKFDGTLPLEKSVKVVNKLEEEIPKKFPQITKAVIHQEPDSMEQS